MNISTVIGRHKSIFRGSPSSTKETGTVRVEVPAIKDIPSIPLAKREKISPKALTVENRIPKAFPSLENVAYPKLDSGMEASPPPSFGEEGLLSYLRRERSHLPQNMEADNYD